MSVLAEVTRLEGAKSSIKTAIENKGVSVPSETLLDGYAPYIDLIKVGDGGIPCTLNIWTTAGATVTATLEDNVVTAVAGEDGIATLILTEEGIWEIHAYDGYTSKTTYINTTYTLSENMPLIGTLEETPWELISSMSKLGKAPEIWNIGDTKSITINGEQHLAQIVAFDHYDVSDPTAYGRQKAGITFQLVNVTGTTYQGIAHQSSADSMVTNCEAIKSFVPTVKFLYRNSGSATTPITTEAKGFSPSESELVGSAAIREKYTLGTQYPYYAAGNSIIKYPPNSENASGWWTRSYSETGGYIVIVYYNGNIAIAANASGYYPICPVFCI